MHNKIPHFNHCTRDGSSKPMGFIKLDGEFIHKIEDLEKFYRTFGYTTDMAKAGILPEEFIWDEYIKNNPIVYTDCFQIHVIEYLIKQSGTFMEKYGEQCEGWIAAHAETVTARGVLCVTCRMGPFCSKTRNRS